MYVVAFSFIIYRQSSVITLLESLFGFLDGRECFHSLPRQSFGIQSNFVFGTERMRCVLQRRTLVDGEM